MRQHGLVRGHTWGRIHMGRVKELSCAACGRFGPSHAHHPEAHCMGGKASDFTVIPLCDSHHDAGIPGVSVHAGRKIWRWSEEELLQSTWAALINARVIPEGTPVGEPYEPVRRVIW